MRQTIYSSAEGESPSVIPKMIYIKANAYDNGVVTFPEKSFWTFTNNECWWMLSFRNKQIKIKYKIIKEAN